MCARSPLPHSSNSSGSSSSSTSRYVIPSLAYSNRANTHSNTHQYLLSQSESLPSCATHMQLVCPPHQLHEQVAACAPHSAAMATSTHAHTRTRAHTHAHTPPCQHIPRGICGARHTHAARGTLGAAKQGIRSVHAYCTPATTTYKHSQATRLLALNRK
jgi:hypothetical protein